MIGVLFHDISSESGRGRELAFYHGSSSKLATCPCSLQVFSFCNFSYSINGWKDNRRPWLFFSRGSSRRICEAHHSMQNMSCQEWPRNKWICDLCNCCVPDWLDKPVCSWPHVTFKGVDSWDFLCLASWSTEFSRWEPKMALGADFSNFVELGWVVRTCSSKLVAIGQHLFVSIFKKEECIEWS